MKQIMVEWVDSQAAAGWNEVEDFDTEIGIVTTLGHLVKETFEVLCVASSLNDHTGQMCGIMFIPKCCIKKVIMLAHGELVASLEDSPWFIGL